MIRPLIRDSFEDLAPAIKSSGLPMHRLCIAGDTNTLPLYGDMVEEALAGSFNEIRKYAFPAGEEHKKLGSVTGLLEFLMQNHFDRKDLIIALGGGVAGDMAGFAASVYLRGIPVIQLPTTLLAQVDSSIGGKTGVDFDGYKNMVGAFHMPALVYTNCSTLKTLPDEQFAAGMGEVIKSALLADKELFYWLKEHSEAVLSRDEEAIRHVIESTASIKVDIVEQDPKEQGIRALLNLGHTIGHAVEKYKDFTMLHGMCVGLGTAAASRISLDRGLITEEEHRSILNVLALYGLPAKTFIKDPEEVLRLTKSDKKMNKGRIRFILLKSIGQAFFTDDVTDWELLAGIREITEEH